MFKTQVILSLLPKAFIVFVIILFAQVLQIYQFKNISPTYDELKYLTSAKILVDNFTWGSINEKLHPPIMYYLAGSSNNTQFSDLKDSLFWARFPFVIFFSIFALIIFIITSYIYGFIPGLFSLTLFAFNPEVLAHSRIISADFISSLGFVIVIFSFILFLNKQTVKTIILFAFCLGFALLTKYTTLILLPFFALFVLFLYKKQFLKVFSKLMFAYLLALFILNLGYLFHGSLELPRSFMSSILNIFFNTPLRVLLFLFPRPFLEGLDLQLAISSAGWWGWFWGKEFVLSPWYVLPASFLIKSPLPLLILIIVTLYISYKKKMSSKYSYELIFLSFIVVFTFYMSVINRVAIGLRYLLPIYPFLFILIGRVVIYKPHPSYKKVAYSAFLVFILCWYILKTIIIAPHFLAYTNEVFGGPANAYKYFVDSNLDWGQNNYYLENYINIHPEVKIEPKLPTSGVIIVDVNDYNLWKRRTFDWLRQVNIKPIGNIGYTWLIFDVKPEQIR